MGSRIGVEKELTDRLCCETAASSPLPDRADIEIRSDWMSSWFLVAAIRSPADTARSGGGERWLRVSRPTAAAEKKKNTADNPSRRPTEITAQGRGVQFSRPSVRRFAANARRSQSGDFDDRPKMQTPLISEAKLSPQNLGFMGATQGSPGASKIHMC